MKRRWLLWLIAIAFAILIISRLQEIKTLLQTLAQGQWQWLLLAALLQLVYYTFYSALYQACFTVVEVKSGLRQLLPLTLGSVFVNMAAPLAGTGGAALFIDDAIRRKQSGARAAAGIVLVNTADLSTFLLVLFGGFAYLLVQGELKTFELIGAIILLALVAGSIGALLVGLFAPQRLLHLLHWLQKAINRIGAMVKHPHILAADWAEENSQELAAAGQALAAHPRRLLNLLGIGLLMHLTDIASLYAVFLAFAQPLRLGVLIAGYSVGVLFWVITITPQGIGTVEGAMVLVFASLGITASKAILVTIAFRGLTLWLPALTGFLLLRQVQALAPGRQMHTEVWSVRAAAFLTGIMGAVNVISAVTPSLAVRLALLGNLPLEIRHGARLTSALAGFALLVLAGNLWRRKRAAWWLTLLAPLLSAVAHMVKGLDYEETSFALALAILLLFLQPHFHARSDWPSVKQGLRMLLVAMLFTLAYGVTGFYLLDRHFSVNFNLWTAIAQTVTMFTAFYGPNLQPLTRLGAFFADSIYTVGAVTLSYALIMLLRPVLIHQPATAAEHIRAEEIVKQYGHSSLARLTLLDDKCYFFSSGGSVLAYVVKGHTALVLGAPIGPKADFFAALTEFTRYCTSNDWWPAFYQVLPDYLNQYKEADFSTLCIGQEAIVGLAKFSLSGRANHDLRSAINRFQRLGYMVEFYDSPLPDSLMQELKLVSDEWLASVHGTEKRFALGWFDDAYIRSCRVVILRAPNKMICAFANIISEYHRNEATIDMMRRIRELENGAMDVLFVSLMQWAKEQGYETFNLGMGAPPVSAAQQDNQVIARTLDYIYQYVNEPLGLEGLQKFKDKFAPAWSPRYLVYPSLPSLPSVAIALAQADSPGGFLQSYWADFTGRFLRRTSQ